MLFRPPGLDLGAWAPTLPSAASIGTDRDASGLAGEGKKSGAIGARSNRPG
jgi:hypothetical protein